MSGWYDVYVTTSGGPNTPVARVPHAGATGTAESPIFSHPRLHEAATQYGLTVLASLLKPGQRGAVTCRCHGISSVFEHVGGRVTLLRSGATEGVPARPCAPCAARRR